VKKGDGGGVGDGDEKEEKSSDGFYLLVKF
jgi:hypothetical protein